MNHLEKLQARARELLGKVRSIHGLTPETVTAEQRAEMVKCLDELDTIKADIAMEERAAAADGYFGASAAATPKAEPEGRAAPKADDKKVFRSFGEQLQAIMRAGSPGGTIDPRLASMRAATGMSEGVPADGGFLVQQDFATTLLRKVYEIGGIASRVMRIPISANSNGLKINAINETSRVDGSRFGGIRAYWTDEAALKTASKPAIRQMELSLKKLTGLCYATDELLQDGAALESVLMQGFSEEINFKVEDAVINGTGAGMPLGILPSPALVTVPKEAGQPAATIVSDNIVKMWSRLFARSQQNAVWLVNQDVFPQLYTMGITVGVGGSPIFQPPGGLSASPYSTLMGRPIVPVEYCATLGTVGDIILADLSQYLMIDKGGIQSASSIHVHFIYDETVFRFVYRCDGQPMWNSVLTPYKGANTQSPFVVLATRA